jgi:hypothetical protein
MQSNEQEPGYKIWGVDNVVYGPVELPTLVNWIQEERVLATSWVYKEADNTWNQAGQLEELKMFFKRRPATSPTGGAAAAASPQRPAIKPGSLRRVKIFAGMSDEQLARFVDFMEVQHVRQWSEVVRQGSPGDAMYLLLEGEARVRLVISGKEKILVTLSPGEFFGEIALFDHGPRSADVVANQDCVLLKIAASAFQRLVSDAPDLAAPFLFAIAKTLTARIRADNKRFQDSVIFAQAANA